MKRKIILSVVLLIVVSSAVFFSYKIYRKQRDIAIERSRLQRRSAGWLQLKKALANKVTNFEGRVGLVVKDLDNEWEIAFNEDKRMPSASLVKVPIMLSCYYATAEGKMDLKDLIRLKSRDKVAGSKVLGSEPVGSVFTAEGLFCPMITESDNAAANMLIDSLGFDALNAYFKKIGLKNTNIARKMMDFKQRRKGKENYTTAKDMAYLLELLYYKKFLNKGVSEQCLELLGQQKINDRIPRKLPEGTYVVHKTGLERHICHDVGIVFTDKGNFLICVLANHRKKIAKPAKKFISDITLLVYNYYQEFN